MPRLAAENACYFVTAVVRDRRCELHGEACSLLQEVLQDCRQKYSFALLAYCIMPDHFHALIAPSERNNISDVMRYIKGGFARLLNRRRGSLGPFWQEGFYETMIRDESQLWAQIEYVHANPVMRGLTTSPEEFDYSSARCPEATDLPEWLGLRGSPNLPPSR